WLRASTCPVIHSLSLHDALPISVVLRVFELAVNGADARGPGGVQLLGEADDGDEFGGGRSKRGRGACPHEPWVGRARVQLRAARSEEHTSELQSREKLVCRLLLE